MTVGEFCIKNARMTFDNDTYVEWFIVELSR